SRSAGGGNGNQPRPVNFLGRILDHALTQIQEWRGQFSQIGGGRLVLQLHDLGRIDYRAAAERDDLVGLIEVQFLHALHHYLDLGLGVGNHGDEDVGSLGNEAPDDVDVPEPLQRRVRNNNGGAGRELMHVLHRIQVEINLIGNPEPHMGLCPPSHALDVEVVIEIDVIGGAVA